MDGNLGRAVRAAFEESPEYKDSAMVRRLLSVFGWILIAAGTGAWVVGTVISVVVADSVLGRFGYVLLAVVVFPAYVALLLLCASGVWGLLAGLVALIAVFAIPVIDLSIALPAAGLVGAGFLGVYEYYSNRILRRWKMSNPETYRACAREDNEESSKRFRASLDKMGTTEIGPREIGRPGEGLTEAIGKFGLQSVQSGIRGEMITAEILKDRLAGIPLAQTIHGLRFPGSENADVDHAVVCGCRVLLLDSKYWAPGHYYWYGNFPARGYGREFELCETYFADAVLRFREALAEKADIVGAFVLHPSHGSITIDESGAPVDRLRMMTGDGIDGLVSWLRRGLLIDEGKNVARQRAVLKALRPYLPAD